MGEGAVDLVVIGRNTRQVRAEGCWQQNSRGSGSGKHEKMGKVAKETTPDEDDDEEEEDDEGGSEEGEGSSGGILPTGVQDNTGNSNDNHR